MFQAAISDCIFMFLWIYTQGMCVYGHTAVKKKKKITEKFNMGCTYPIFQ